jgi:hypothetical protein
LPYKYIVNMQDYLGNTPLHNICMAKYFWGEVYDLKRVSYLFYALLKHPNININIQNKSGETPLDIALKEYNDCAAQNNYSLAPIQLTMIKKLHKKLMINKYQNAKNIT